MSSSRIVLVDPHITDEFFTPIRFFIKKRRGLNKYLYFTKIQSETIVAFTFSRSGVISNNIFSKLPKYIRMVVVLFEYVIWRLLQKNNVKLSSLKEGDIAVYPLRNINNLGSKFLRVRRCKVAWVMSHFHISIANANYIADNDIILADNFNVSLDKLCNRVVLCPPCITSRFVNKKKADERSEKIIATGTIHLYRNEFPGSVKYKDNYTMHPSRADVFFSNSAVYFKNFSIVTDNDSLYSVQKSYMAQDIVEMYNRYKYAFIGSEVSGVFALGLVEAMACGCEVFVEESIASYLGLQDGIHAWLFDGTAKGMEQKYNDIIENSLSLDKVAVQSFSDKFRLESLTEEVKGQLLK
ncbi:hypothetical protein QNE95_002332 [Vibrio vulnificus]|nr:hypothetical protein [Vibrio vulnificus]EKS7723112.1 hypothetical protein [Vibrio vulnificus]ELM6617095.1 hypothetical protein [Vibrio vulnificus]ELP3504252.1 hypothetical protein [Vibrio vulnificus]ELP3553096.1 hypothetical protein [Vibrio vulnificus]